MAFSLGEGRRRTLTLAGIAVVVIAVAVGAAIQFELIDVGDLLGEKKAPPTPAPKPAPVAAATPAKPEPPKTDAGKGEPGKGAEAAKPAPKPAAPEAETAEIAHGTTVIPGAWAWNVETNELTSTAGADVLWEQASPTERSLVPQRGAGLASAGDAKYESLSAAELAALKYTEAPLSGSDKGGALDAGAVFALRTTEGNVAKLRVTKYFSSHNFNFAGNQVLTQPARQRLRIRPPVERYNIEVEWALYRPQTAVAVAPAPKVSAKPAAVAAVKPAAEAKPGATLDALDKLKTGAAASAPAARKPGAGPRRLLAAASPAGPPPKVITPKYNDVMTAVLYGDRAGVAELLDLGRWIDKPDARGYTPLMAAALNRDAPMAELLLARGANPNVAGDGGVTALRIARENGDSDMAALLEKRGAKP